MELTFVERFILFSLITGGVWFSYIMISSYITKMRRERHWGWWLHDSYNREAIKFLEKDEIRKRVMEHEERVKGITLIGKGEPKSYLKCKDCFHFKYDCEGTETKSAILDDGTLCGRFKVGRRYT